MMRLVPGRISDVRCLRYRLRAQDAWWNEPVYVFNKKYGGRYWAKNKEAFTLPPAKAMLGKPKEKTMSAKPKEGAVPAKPKEKPVEGGGLLGAMRTLCPNA